MKYLHCLNCRIRCRRTGKKEVMGYGYRYYEQVPIYAYEYECSNCSSMFVWDQYRNIIHRGCL